MFKASLGYSLVKCLVPDAAGLMHAVDAFHQLHNPSFFTRGFKPRGLFHVHSFVVWEDAMQKGSFDVELLKVPIKGGGDVQKGLKRFEAHSWCSGFIVVNPVTLGKAFSDVTYFVMDNVKGFTPLSPTWAMW